MAPREPGPTYQFASTGRIPQNRGGGARIPVRGAPAGTGGRPGGGRGPAAAHRPPATPLKGVKASGTTMVTLPVAYDPQNANRVLPRRS